MASTANLKVIKPFIFVSYSWDKKTDEDVRSLAKFLQSSSHFDKVWIDIGDMKNEPLGEQIAENIKRADLVLICFNNHYQSRQNCQKEVKLADYYQRPIMFVKMEKDEVLVRQPWFDAIILDNKFTDYYKAQNPQETILKAILDKLHINDTAVTQQMGALKIRESTSSSASTTSTLTTVKAPPRPTIPKKVKPPDELFDAAKWGELEKVKTLVQQGIDVNAKNKKDTDWTPLLYAASQGHQDVVAFLIENGSNLEDSSTYGWTPLIAACLNGRTDACQVLVEKGANLRATDSDGWTPLISAVSNERDDIVFLLVEKDSSMINLTDISGKTALQWAIDKNYEDIAEYLKSKGAI